MNDTDDKDQLPVHLLIHANDFAKICTRDLLCVGRHGHPAAEFMHLGWSIMSPGAETDTTSAYMAYMCL